MSHHIIIRYAPSSRVRMTWASLRWLLYDRKRNAWRIFVTSSWDYIQNREITLSASHIIRSNIQERVFLCLASFLTKKRDRFMFWYIINVHFLALISFNGTSAIQFVSRAFRSSNLLFEAEMFFCSSHEFILVSDSMRGGGWHLISSFTLLSPQVLPFFWREEWYSYTCVEENHGSQVQSESSFGG